MKHINKMLLLSAFAAMIGACNKDDDDNNDAMNQTDRDFMVQAAYGNRAEIDAGQLAASKGDDIAFPG